MPLSLSIAFVWFLVLFFALDWHCWVAFVCLTLIGFTKNTANADRRRRCFSHLLTHDGTHRLSFAKHKKKRFTVRASLCLSTYIIATHILLLLHTTISYLVLCTFVYLWHSFPSLSSLLCLCVRVIYTFQSDDKHKEQTLYKSHRAVTIVVVVETTIPTVQKANGNCIICSSN